VGAIGIALASAIGASSKALLVRAGGGVRAPRQSAVNTSRTSLNPLQNPGCGGAVGPLAILAAVAFGRMGFGPSQRQR
jgi:hypothetical protein